MIPVLFAGIFCESKKYMKKSGEYFYKETKGICFFHLKEITLTT